MITGSVTNGRHPIPGAGAVRRDELTSVGVSTVSATRPLGTGLELSALASSVPTYGRTHRVATGSPLGPEGLGSQWEGWAASFLRW